MIQTEYGAIERPNASADIRWAQDRGSIQLCLWGTTAAHDSPAGTDVFIEPGVHTSLLCTPTIYKSCEHVHVSLSAAASATTAWPITGLPTLLLREAQKTNLPARNTVAAATATVLQLVVHLPPRCCVAGAPAGVARSLRQLTRGHPSPDYSTHMTWRGRLP